MKTAYRILNRTLVREFYRANASFFLLVIGLAGGFMRAHDHIALAMILVSAPSLLLIPIAIWILYTVKVIEFNRETLNRDENEFLFHFSLFPHRPQWLVLLTTLTIQLLPAILYGFFLIVMAIRNHLLIPVLILAPVFPVLIILSSYVLRKAFRQPDQEHRVSRLKRMLDTSFTKPFCLFFIEWIARRQPMMIIGTKIFSAAVLLAVTYLYSTDTYDERLLFMGIAVSFSAHAQLISEMHRFDNFHFAIVRQLPIHFSKRFLYLVLTTLLLILPEIGLLLNYFPPDLSNVILPQAILFGLSIPVFFYGSLYRKDRSQEQVARFVFLMAMVWIVLVLFKVPPPGLLVLNFLAGVYWWRKNFFGFEYISGNDEN